MKKILYISVFIGLLFSCQEEPVETVFFNFTGSRGVYVLNEGNFMYGNSSLSFYDFADGEVYNRIFQARNGAPLGDVAQSMKLWNNQIFIVVNNSGKIYVVDSNSSEFKGSITGLSSPRYIHFVDDTKAYVTDLYAKEITVINPSTLEIIGRIDVRNGHSEFNQHSTEQMIQYQQWVFINCWSYDNQILVVDSEDDALIDSIEVLKQPVCMAMDAEKKIWVITDGGFEGNPLGYEAPGLLKIDAETREIERVFRFQLGDKPNGLCMNGSGDSLLFLNRHVWKMAVSDTKLPENPFIESPYKDSYGGFYSLAIDTVSSDIYVGDAIDHQQSGMIRCYSQNGILKNTFRVGVAPGCFLFKY